MTSTAPDADDRLGVALWQQGDGDGFDRCALLPAVVGARLSGTASLPELGRGAVARYLLVVDHAWWVRGLDVRVSAPGTEARVRLTADEPGRWHRDGVPLPELDGCLDVALEFTPVALTPLVRRLDLAPGASSDVDVLALAVPSLEVRRERVRLTHEVGDRWRVTRGGREVGVRIGPHGLTTECDGRWRAVALG